VPLVDWGSDLLAECKAIAAALDEVAGDRRHADALAWAAGALRESRQLASARVLDAMQREHAGSHTRFSLAASERSREVLMALPFKASDRESVPGTGTTFARGAAAARSRRNAPVRGLPQGLPGPGAPAPVLTP
jgi:gamma-glutamylcysteine synthetase